MKMANIDSVFDFMFTEGVRPGSQYLASRLEVNVNARANARIELGSILAFVVRLH